MQKNLRKRIELIPYGGNEPEEGEENSYFKNRAEDDFVEVGLAMSEKGFTDDEVIKMLSTLYSSTSDVYGC
jgi:hypothetical protein